MKLIGYRKTDDDNYENEVQYGQRMCGVIALHAAIMQTNMPTLSYESDQYGVKMAWSWLARMCNLTPRRLTPQLILIFLQVCGNSLLAVYKNQALKLLNYIMAEMVPRIPIEAKPATVRLVLFLNDNYGNILIS
jgi:nucleoporin GLE1